MKFTHDKVKKKVRFTGANGMLVVVADDYTRPCPKCGQPAPLELRQTGNGPVYDQPYCGPCRNKKA
jgi:hypothetical protein